MENQVEKLGGKFRWKIVWRSLVEKLSGKLGGKIWWKNEVENQVVKLGGKLGKKIGWKIGWTNWVDKLGGKIRWKIQVGKLGEKIGWENLVETFGGKIRWKIGWKIGWTFWVEKKVYSVQCTLYSVQYTVEQCSSVCRGIPSVPQHDERSLSFQAPALPHPSRGEQYNTVKYITGCYQRTADSLLPTRRKQNPFYTHTKNCSKIQKKLGQKIF